MFWSDPALGIARYADAGYPEALAEATRSGSTSREGRGREARWLSVIGVDAGMAETNPLALIAERVSVNTREDELRQRRRVSATIRAAPNCRSTI